MYRRLPFLSAVESVDEGTKGGVSELLSEASRLLPSSTSSNTASNSTCPAAIPQATINESLRRAQAWTSDIMYTRSSRGRGARKIEGL